jgi:hypothetical protein
VDETKSLSRDDLREYDMTAGSQPDVTKPELGGNKFMFAGGGVSVTYFPVRPGPMVAGEEGGEFTYEGPEGTMTFHGKDIDRADGSLGTLLTVVLQPNVGGGGRNITVVLPTAFGVGQDTPVRFATAAIRTTGRGNINTPGVAFAYEVLPLTGEAHQVIMPEL